MISARFIFRTANSGTRPRRRRGAIIPPLVDVDAEVRISDGTRTIISSKLFTGMSRARSRSSAAPLSLKVASVSQALAVAEFQSFRRARPRDGRCGSTVEARESKSQRISAHDCVAG
jgi:hypothetical protein